MVEKTGSGSEPESVAGETAGVAQDMSAMPEGVVMAAVAAYEPSSRLERAKHLTASGGRLSLRAFGAAAGTCIALHLFPYDTSLAGVPVDVSVSTLGNKGLSGDTTLGSVAFHNVDGLPVGVHATPQIDLNNIRTISTSTGDFIQELNVDFTRKVTGAHWYSPTEAKDHWAAAITGGALTGAAMAEALRLVGMLAGAKGRRRLFDSLEEVSAPQFMSRLGGQAVAASTAFAVATAGVGMATYNPDWQRSYEVTGLLADMKAAPNKLAELYTKDTTAATKVSTLLSLENVLTAPAERAENSKAAFKILMISDMHLRFMYPYLKQLILDQNIGMVINTGDESEDGTSYEMTSQYQDGIKSITELVPMLFVAGNHDSPETDSIMAKNGVIVLGTKVQQPDGSFKVGGKTVNVYGLNIAGLPDPRVFGGEGSSGSDDSNVTDPLELQDVKAATTGYTPDVPIDIAMTHEPVAAVALQKALKARLVASGHLHQENPLSAIQSSGYINLNEGSTGMGGIDHYDTAPMEFSVLSVGADCEFTTITRYQLSDPTSSVGNGNSQIVTYIFKPQPLKNRVCSINQGISSPEPWSQTALALGGHK